MGRELERILERGTIWFSKQTWVPKGHRVVYVHIVVKTREHRVLKERVRFAIGGDQVYYLEEVATRIIELNNIKSTSTVFSLQTVFTALQKF